ncbi:MAG: methionyl-tRNA formyltransferase [Bacteroidetes bacterium]|nr:methionyl-tRNA formyltransferase [Bacteroidota bacterium]MBP7399015.1 hypothetical protein [Chitinophagales bacterium]MBK8486906.1 methionyl-tRNA formyltransferase [Bacteroidota bacterium]MBK8681196.1 methionyl-tRNA formyltransferase [Bacteroidota bacterium]MBP8753812.1 hypothetical protein [Chitinophagales bacterium]
MSKKGFKVLEALINNNYQSAISAVIVGRDNNIDYNFANEIIAICKQNNILYFERNERPTINSDYSIAISWRWLIHENSLKIIVLHDSLLPKYRGHASLVNMLINKEKEIGVSAIFASKEYDSGDIISQSSIPINYPIKISTAIDLVIENYIALVLEIFITLLSGKTLTSIAQEEALASYSLWRDEDDYLINWKNDSNDILNFINAVSSPYKGAATYINGLQKIRILDAAIETDVQIENRDIGKVIFTRDKYPVIVCGSGLLKLNRVVDDTTHEDALPFKSFRLRLTNYVKN